MNPDVSKNKTNNQKSSNHCLTTTDCSLNPSYGEPRVIDLDLFHREN